METLLDQHQVATYLRVTTRTLRAHRSQSRKDWFTADTFLTLMRLRGVECRSPSGFAEAFHGCKIRLAGL